MPTGGYLRLPDHAADPHRREPGQLVKTGEPGCRFINVESEFAALSVAIGASATGARAYTATASQGLLFMAEAVYNASGLGLPIVMTIGNRAIGHPSTSGTTSGTACQCAMPAGSSCMPRPIRRRWTCISRRCALQRAVGAGDGVRRRVHPDPRLRACGPAVAGTGRCLCAGV